MPEKKETLRTTKRQRSTPREIRPAYPSRLAQHNVGLFARVNGRAAHGNWEMRHSAVHPRRQTARETAGHRRRLLDEHFGVQIRAGKAAAIAVPHRRQWQQTSRRINRREVPRKIHHEQEEEKKENLRHCCSSRCRKKSNTRGEAGIIAFVIIHKTHSKGNG